MIQKRKRIFILIIAIIFVVGCTPAHNDENIKVIKNEPVTIRIYTNKCTNEAIASDDIANEIYASEYFNSWEDLLLDKYNLDIKLHFVALSDFIFEEGEAPFDYMKDYDMVINENGKVFSESYYYYMKFDLIQPYNDFLEESAAWNSLPAEFTSTYKDAKGNIWAIPFSDNITVFGRAINRTWLENLSIAEPNSVNQLYETLKLFTYKDPDKNGTDDTYGLSVLENSGSIISFKDIFEANGCYLTYQHFNNINNSIRFTAVPIGFNPESGRIENNSVGIGFKESLDLISALISENIISMGGNDFIDGHFSNPKIGTYYGIIKDNIVYPDKYNYVFALDGLNKTNTSSVFRDGEGAYFLSKYANEPEKLVPSFIDTFYNSKEGFILGHYGLTGEEYQYSETSKGLVVNTIYNEHEWNIQLVGDLTWHDVEVSYKDKDFNNVEKLDINKLVIDDRLFILSQKHMLIGKNILVKLPGSTSSGDNYQAHFSNTFNKFILGKISADDVLYELEKINKLFDVDEWIEEANSQWFGN